ncbi:MAG: hypothetical protein ACK5JM_02525 [Rhodoblastus sp.]
MKILIAGASCLLLTACARPAPPQFLRAADPAAPGGRLVVADGTAGARNFGIVEPADWATTNRRVTPAYRPEAKQQGQGRKQGVSHEGKLHEGKSHEGKSHEGKSHEGGKP